MSVCIEKRCLYLTQFRETLLRPGDPTLDPLGSPSRPMVQPHDGVVDYQEGQRYKSDCAESDPDRLWHRYHRAIVWAAPRA